MDDESIELSITITIIIITQTDISTQNSSEIINTDSVTVNFFTTFQAFLCSHHTALRESDLRSLD